MESARTWVSDFPPPELWEINVCCWSHPDSSILSEQPERTKRKIQKVQGKNTLPNSPLGNTWWLLYVIETYSEIRLEWRSIRQEQTMLITESPHQLSQYTGSLSADMECIISRDYISISYSKFGQGHNFQRTLPSNPIGHNTLVLQLTGLVHGGLKHVKSHHSIRQSPGLDNKFKGICSMRTQVFK